MDIVLRSVTTDDLQFLYNLLAERPPEANISHRKMPTFEEHCRFVNSRPYKKWYIIWHVHSDEGVPGGMVRVGNIYLTAHNEIGIFIARAHQRLGLGRMAISQIMAEDTSLEYLANIAPANAKSRNLFTSMGFQHIQETYVKRQTM